MRNIYKPLLIRGVMAEKRSEKKLIVLLVVLVAASLVVDLLSLHVLYSLDNMQGLKGSLATTPPWYTEYYDPDLGRFYDSDFESGCDVVISLDSVDSCMRDCFIALGSCKFDACEEEFDCEKAARREQLYYSRELGFEAMPGFCSYQRDSAEETCDVEYENCKASSC